MIYAQVLNNVIVNVIVLDDVSLIPVFTRGFDDLIEISVDPGSPSIGWIYDPNSNKFSPPTE